jgi:sensor histidine kinase YesM
MKRSPTQQSLLQIQAAIWLLVSLAMFISMQAMDGARQALTYTLVNILSYAMIIYGNIYLLHPRLWMKGKKIAYVSSVLVMVVLVALFRLGLFYYTYLWFFYTKPVNFPPTIIVSYALSGIMIFAVSFIIKYAIDYFHLLEVNEGIRLKQSKAELDLLKSQVNPHFLFNTLNNIYYEAYLEAPKTALLIERLADMMRYMLAENTRDSVKLSKEIGFLENYIALEQIRMLHDLEIDFRKSYDQDVELPPMLLIAFTENIFKHGIDKSSEKNKVSLDLRQDGKWLHFSTKNTLPENDVKTVTGSGLENLKQRLNLLYPGRFELLTSVWGDHFQAYLKIPLD